MTFASHLSDTGTVPPKQAINDDPRGALLLSAVAVSPLIFPVGILTYFFSG